MSRMTTGSAGEAQAERHEPDIVGQYLNQIGSTPLLSADDEVMLAKRIEAGLYAAELLKQVDSGAYALPEPLRADLARIARQGRDAKKDMINANLRLVVSEAKKHLRSGMPFADIIQEGNLGLIRAVEKFDYAKGYKFSTYAMWWIRQAIGRGMADQPRTVRLPAHVLEQLNKFDRVERSLATRLGREPTTDELAAEAGTTPEKLTELRSAAREVISLDLPVGDDGETSVGELLDDSEQPRAADVVEYDEFLNELHALVRGLPARKAHIVELRFGLRDGHRHTLQDVAERLGVARERVRQLEKQALAELRKPESKRLLLDWAS